MTTTDFDLFIIGGGINGCGIARDAAGRGFSVALAEMNDLASGTSSASTKLIHGGLRYLEHYEFRLVREALGEREILLRMAPHLIRPMRFVLPHHRALRPAWMLRAGLFLYDHLGKRELLPGSTDVDLRRSETGNILKSSFERGFEYSDCWVDDARLVALNARDAADKGAQIMVRSKVTSARPHGDLWRIEVREQSTDIVREFTAKFLVNAAGPWVDDVLRRVTGSSNARNVRLVQGSHVVVRRLYPHDRAYLFQNADGRIIFLIPYETDFTVIGTTDTDYDGDPSAVLISAAERKYLCDVASRYLNVEVAEQDIVWAYSGVRPLYDDGASAAQEATRDYVLKMAESAGTPLLNVFGGKITTYRRLAESVLERIEARLGARKPAWTAGSHLPGGKFPPEETGRWINELSRAYPFLGSRQATRMLRAYGTLAWTILSDAKGASDLGASFGALSEREAAYLVDREWATTADDIAWRRSKLGLTMNVDELGRLSAWVEARSSLSKQDA